jgi:hypothetical protein
MKYLKLYEDYDPNIHRAINMTKKSMSSNTSKKILHIISVIDDIIHLDFKNIKNSFKNKEGFRKTANLMMELGFVVKALEADKDRSELGLFYDLNNYEIDVDLILDYLKDENVIDYLKNDKRASTRMNKYNDAIKFLKKFKEWKTINR